MDKKTTAYILCYTMRIPKLDAEPFKVPYVQSHHWDIYSETTAEGATPIIQAKYALKKLMNNPNVYTWNLSKLVKTSEHYKTTK